MLLSPPISDTNIELKMTAGSPVHTTGDFYTFNVQHNTFGIINKTDLNIIYPTGETKYNGHVKITITGVRRKDGTTLHLGTCLHYPQGTISTPININATDTTLAAQANIITSDAAWQSWTNGGTISSVGIGLESYIRMDLFGTAPWIQFYKTHFATRQLDPLYNMPFLNDYALDYTIKLELLHRKPTPLDNTNTIKVIPNIEQNRIAGGQVYRPTVNATQGTTADIASRFCKGAGYKPFGIWIQQDATFDFIFHGNYVNETGTIGTSRFRRFSEVIKPDGVNKHVTQLDHLRKSIARWGAAQSPAITITNSGFPIVSFAIDESDPGNGGRPTMYHNTRYGASTATRQIGWTSFDGTATNNTTYGAPTQDAGGFYNGGNAYDKLPNVGSTGDIQLLSGTAWTSPPRPIEIITSCRTNNRPAIFFTDSPTAEGLAFNNGTYTAPVYNRAFRFDTGTAADSANVRYPHNYAGTNVDLLKAKKLVHARRGDGDWVYLLMRNTANNRYFFRMRYSGAATKTIAQVWDFANWTVEELANFPAAAGTGTTTNGLTATTTYTLTSYPDSFYGFLQTVDTTRMVNGYPTFWGFMYNKFCKVTHNGGSSATLSDNWNLEVLAGGTSTTTTDPTEGTGFTNTDFAKDNLLSWTLRQQIQGDWLYWGNSTDDYMGRININSTSGDYLKFEVLTNPNITSLLTTRL